MACERAERFIEALRRLEWEGDVDRMVTLFATDAELHSPTDVSPQRGHEGARRYWETYLRTFGEVHSDFRTVIETDGVAALEWTSRGTTNGGREFDYDGVIVLEFGDDGIRRFRAYFDPSKLGEVMLGMR